MDNVYVKPIFVREKKTKKTAKKPFTHTFDFQVGKKTLAGVPQFFDAQGRNIGSSFTYGGRFVSKSSPCS